MSDHFVSPDRDLIIGEQKLTLSASFATFRTIQQGFDMDLLDVQARVLDMRLDEVARLIALASGSDEDEIGQLLLDEIDPAGMDYKMLKADLMTWLAVAMTPKRDREKKARQLTETLAKLRNPASPGENIKNSASAISAGPRKRSGKATSGK